MGEPVVEGKGQSAQDSPSSLTRAGRRTERDASDRRDRGGSKTHSKSEKPSGTSRAERSSRMRHRTDEETILLRALEGRDLECGPHSSACRLSDGVTIDIVTCHSQIIMMSYKV